MRLIAWNANYTVQKRSFLEDAGFLFSEGADIAVLSETARPLSEDPGQVAWIGGGKNPGLGVMAGNGFSLVPWEGNAGAPPLSGAFLVKGPISFSLLTVWPVTTKGGPSYDQLLHTTLDHFSEFLRDERTILVGDLNTSSKVREQGQSHPRFVARADSMGLASLYHEMTGERHGQETVPTYRHSGRGKGLFHLDYAFLSPTLRISATNRVLAGPKWEARSDHFPIVIDIPNA